MSEWTPEHQALYEMSDEELSALAERVGRGRRPNRAEVLETLKTTDPLRYERLHAKAERELAAADQRNLDHFARKVAAREAEIQDQSQAIRGERQLSAIGRGWANLMGGK